MTNTNTANETETSKYTGLWNGYGQCIVVPAVTAHLPHIEVIWYSHGMWTSGYTHVAADETHEQAAERAFGDRWNRETMRIRTPELRSEYWRAPDFYSR